MKKAVRKPVRRTNRTRAKARAKKAGAGNASVRKKAKVLEFLHKSTCATCRKARNLLEDRGYTLHFRDLAKERLSVAELQKLIGTHDHQEFLNPRCELYRKKKMKDNPPSRREAIGMMAMDPDLIRRPIVVAGGRVAIGYDENGKIRF
jgi:Spx/MgsR family transcriptional regulator